MAETDYVRFKESRVNDRQPSWMLEDSIQLAAALGGIHDFDFADDINLDFATAGDLSDFDLPGEGTWTLVDEQLQGVGGGSSVWYRLLHLTEVAPSFVASFDKITDNGGFVFCGGSYVAFWSASSVGFAVLDASGAQTAVVTYSDAYTGEAAVDVAVRYQSMTDFDVVDWLSAAMYVDGRCVVAMSQPVSGMSVSHEVGFATYASNTVTVDNFRVAELKRIVEWTSVDPGEPIAAGMNRAIGTTPVFYFCRFDGTLRAWVPGDRALDWTVPASRLLAKATRKSFFTPPHIRMVGAYHEASTWDQARAEKQARQLFTIADDPNLMTEAEAYEGAQRAAQKIYEGENQHNLVMPGNPLVEPQDRITDSTDDMRVGAIQFQVRKQEGAPVFKAQLECTDYEEEA